MRLRYHALESAVVLKFHRRHKAVIFCLIVGLRLCPLSSYPCTISPPTQCTHTYAAGFWCISIWYWDVRGGTRARDSNVGPKASKGFENLCRLRLGRRCAPCGDHGEGPCSACLWTHRHGGRSVILPLGCFAMWYDFLGCAAVVIFACISCGNHCAKNQLAFGVNALCSVHGAALITNSLCTTVPPFPRRYRACD